jgi:hypothetical protein
MIEKEKNKVIKVSFFDALINDEKASIKIQHRVNNCDD